MRFTAYGKAGKKVSKNFTKNLPVEKGCFIFAIPSEMTEGNQKK